jgi:hypothetical protein
LFFPRRGAEFPLRRGRQQRQQRHFGVPRTDLAECQDGDSVQHGR